MRCGQVHLGTSHGKIVTLFDLNMHMGKDMKTRDKKRGAVINNSFDLPNCVSRARLLFDNRIDLLSLSNNINAQPLFIFLSVFFFN